MLRSPALWLLALTAVVAAAGVNYVLKLKSYFIMPDELTYERGALHIASTGRPVLPGDPYYQSISELGSLVVAPAWALVHPVGRALDVSHAINALAFSTSCVPVFLLARRITRDAVASLFAAACSVAVPWFAMSGTLMTEPVAYPAFCWGVLGIQRAVAEPGSRGDVVGILGVGLAVAARSQLAVLGIVLAVSMLVRESLAARSEGLAVVTRRHAVLIGMFALAVLYVLVRGTSARDIVGDYTITAQGEVLPGGTLAYARALVTSVSIACAALPLPLALAWALGGLRRPSRPDVFAGALALLLAGVVMAVVAGAFSVRFASGQNDRYISYLAPLLFTGAAAALTIGPLRIVDAAVAGAASAWLLWTSTLAVQVPSLTSPGAAFRTVVDGRTRLLAGWFGVSDAKPTAVVAVLVLLALGVLLLAPRRLSARAVGAVVGTGVLLFGLTETAYTLKKISDTQAGASPEFVAGRGWADRAVPDGAPLHALVSFVSDTPTTTATWWDAMFYNREVDSTYVLRGMPFYEQPSYLDAKLDPRTGALDGLPGGYLLVAAQPVHVGLAGARPIAQLGAVALVQAPLRPRAAFSLDVADGTGLVPMDKRARLRVFGAGEQRVAVTVVARGGPMRAALDGGRGSRPARTLAPDTPATLRASARPSASRPATLALVASRPASGAAKGATLQTLDVSIGH